jgi:hypothetical protein
MMKRFLLGLTTLLFGMAVFSGCDRSIDSKNPVRTLPDTPPAPINLEAALNDRSVTLFWEISDTDVVALFRIYSAADTSDTFRLIDSTPQFSKDISELPFDQDMRIRITSVTSHRLESAPSAEIHVVTGLLQMLIEGGEKYATARDVSLQFSSPVTPAYVELSEEPNLGDAIIQEFVSPMPFVLSQGDGVKTVYARLTFADGSEAGEILSDDITLDTYARIDSVYYSPIGETFSAGDTIRFYVRAGGEIGGGAQVVFGSSTRVNLKDLGTYGDAVAGDGIYSFAWVVPVGLTVTDGTITAAFTDAAGNNASQAQAAELLNIHTTTQPTPVVLAAGLVAAETAQLSWTLNNDDDFAEYRVYRSVSPGINVTDDFLMIAIVTDQGTTSVPDHLSGAGTYYYRVFVFDSEGLFTGSNEVVVSL